MSQSDSGVTVEMQIAMRRALLAMVAWHSLSFDAIFSRLEHSEDEADHRAAQVIRIVQMEADAEARWTP